MHQPDVTGNSDETELPLYYQGFCHYFSHIEVNPTARNRNRGQQQRLKVVNRSLIGQQAVLTTNVEDPPIMNRSSAQRNRTRGSLRCNSDRNFSR